MCGHHHSFHYLYHKSSRPSTETEIQGTGTYHLQGKSESFDYFYVDIYNYVLSPKVVDDYKFFMKLHNIEEYVFCGLEHFLLSCSYEEIIWVYIPETWMDMAKGISTALSISGYIKGYKQLDEKLVSTVLAQFKEVFNEEL